MRCPVLVGSTTEPREVAGLYVKDWGEYEADMLTCRSWRRNHQARPLLKGLAGGIPRGRDCCLVRLWWCPSLLLHELDERVELGRITPPIPRSRTARARSSRPSLSSATAGV